MTILYVTLPISSVMSMIVYESTPDILLTLEIYSYNFMNYFSIRTMTLYGYGTPSQLPAMGMSPGMPNPNTRSANPIVFSLRR